MIEEICRLLKISKTTYYNYKKLNIPIFEFVSQLSKNELIEIQQTGSLKKLNLIKEYDTNTLIELLKSQKSERTDTIFTKEQIIYLGFLLQKIDNISYVDKEGFLLLLYRIIRDFEIDLNSKNIKEKFYNFTKQYNLLKIENMKNILTKLNKNNTIEFIDYNLSSADIVFLVENKKNVLPYLKGLRKYNKNLND